MTPEERLNLQREHIESMEDFYNESCQSSMNQLRSIKMPNLYYPIKPLRYEISRLIDQINIKFNKKHPLNTRHSILQK